MKQLTLSNKQYLFVEVPEDAAFYETFNGVLKFEQKNAASIWISKYIEIPDGEWLKPIKASEVTEEQWINIVEGRLNENLGTELFKNYMVSEYGEWLKTATESGLSLLRSIGMKPEKTVILTEK